MNLSTLIKLCLGIIIWLFVITISLELVTMPNTLYNILGFFLVILISYTMIETRILTKFTIKKHEKHI